MATLKRETRIKIIAVLKQHGLEPKPEVVEALANVLIADKYAPPKRVSGKEKKHDTKFITE